MESIIPYFMVFFDIGGHYRWINSKNLRLLKKGIMYRFSICSSKDYSGEAILKIYDTNRLMGSTYIPATGKTYPSVDLKISKTGPYHIMLSFKDGEQGLAVALLSYVKTL